ncbi:hypothetical protein LCGC14_2935160, partial [marine sediment metagenome]
DPEHAVRRSFGGKTQPLRGGGEGFGGQRRVQRHAAVQQPARRQPAEQQIRVGHRRLGAAVSIAGRARFGAGGDFLFGRFSIADAMFAPVVTRFASYHVTLGEVEKSAEQGKLLARLKKSQSRQAAQQQEQLKAQLGTTIDNRAARYYARQQTAGRKTKAGGVDFGVARRADRSGAPAEWRMRRGPPQRGDGRPVRPSSGWVRGGAGTGEDVAARTLADVQAGLVADMSFGRYTGGTVAAPAQPGLGYGYVPGGTFSLPVALPEGQVRLDFARPSGEATVSVWAVRGSIVRKGMGTGGAFAAILVLMLVVQLVRELRGRKSLSLVGFVLCYVLLGLLLAAIAGMLGAAAAVGIVCVAEIVRRASAGRAARA